ncbi:MAG: alcohol dehydrogenase catalytic domain-containing protein [Myxococcales bacterium]|nr:alcohol dehydrogenase catalytic domain-containing protein [Myxococcales bacterium]
MQALVFDGGAPALRELPRPAPGPGEALVRVRMAGVCNTDLEIVGGYMGFSGVLGHEFCGVVEASDDPSWLGQRVAGEINQACGHCDLCARGLGRHCPERSVLGIVEKPGCFAEYLTLKLDSLHRLPPELSDARASFVEPTAAAYEILEQVAIGPEHRVAVLGDGKLGLLIAQVILTTGCKPHVIGRHPKKLELAERFGARVAEPETLSPKSFDCVIEATGSPSGLQRALGLTRPRGTLVLKSTYHAKLELDAAPIVIDELSIVGSRCGPFEPAIAALSSNAINPDPMIDAVFPLAQAPEALARAAEPGVLKVLLEVSV